MLCIWVYLMEIRVGCLLCARSAVVREESPGTPSLNVLNVFLFSRTKRRSDILSDSVVGL